MKRNLFRKKAECWECNSLFHRVVITKYHGILCKNCYRELYNEIKALYFDFFNSFEIEFDTSLEEYTETIESMTEYICEYYKGCQDFKFAPEHNETIQKVKDICKIIRR